MADVVELPMAAALDAGATATPTMAGGVDLPMTAPFDASAAARPSMAGGVELPMVAALDAGAAASSSWCPSFYYFWLLNPHRGITLVCRYLL